MIIDPSFDTTYGIGLDQTSYVFEIPNIEPVQKIGTLKAFTNCIFKTSVRFIST